jgi:pimeloyl-ACP methyl ester carboxylesterase
MRTFTHRIPGLVLTGHEFSLPLDYRRPRGEQITVFAREVVAADQAGADLPWLLYLQGGPGFGSPRPLEQSGWIKRAVQDYRLLLLDQRGTGLSTPVCTQALTRFPNPQAQADYLKHFRADNIVRDAESIRRELVGEAGKWSVLGQSFGGFCVTHYLSVAPHALCAALITGGLPPLARPADDVYRATYRRVREKNRRFYERYPEDVERVQAIVRYLAQQDVRLPGGGRLTPRRFQQLGFELGASDGFERVHYLLEEAFLPGARHPELSLPFLRQVEPIGSFETNPIFAILHEAIYCQGGASRWAAERIRGEYPDFEPDPARTVLFTGEMVYPWMFDQYPHLQPLREAAHLLAEYEDWPPLYDETVLRTNSVPCAAAIYYDDMYVERTFSEETAAAIAGIKVWVTNEYEHNGLRADGEKVLGRLLDMVRGLT